MHIVIGLNITKYRLKLSTDRLQKVAEAVECWFAVASQVMYIYYVQRRFSDGKLQNLIRQREN